MNLKLKNNVFMLFFLLYYDIISASHYRKGEGKWEKLKFSTLKAETDA